MKTIKIKAAKLTPESMVGFVRWAGGLPQSEQAFIDPPVPYWWNYMPHPLQPGRGKTSVVHKKPLKKGMRKLYKAMMLPFDQAMPIIRGAICKDYTLAFNADISAWCARHATEIAATLKSERNKH
jgi:hypothetical protein